MAQMPNIKNRAENGQVGVLIVDDQPVVRERFQQLISGEPDMIFCGDCDNPDTAFQLINAERPDVVVTGLAIRGSHGLEFIKDLHVRYPNLKVLVFSIYDESLYSARAIRAGAAGFLTKREPTAEVVAAIRNVISGEIHLSRLATSEIVRRFFARSAAGAASELEQLSDRELEVFELIGRRYGSREIANVLHLDMKTVQTYRSRIKVKLGLHNGGELSAQAQQSLRHTTSGRRRTDKGM